MDTKTTYFVRYDPTPGDITLHFYKGFRDRMSITPVEHLFCVHVTHADASKILFSIRETRFYHGEPGVLSLLRDLYRVYVKE